MKIGKKILVDPKQTVLCLATLQRAPNDPPIGTQFWYTRKGCVLKSEFQHNGPKDLLFSFLLDKQFQITLPVQGDAWPAFDTTIMVKTSTMMLSII